LAQPPVKHPRKQIQPEPSPEKAFGQALREVRQSKEISQERLALDGGFDRTYISLIERGINSPTIRVLVGIAAVPKVPPSRIVRRMEELMPATKLEPKATQAAQIALTTWGHAIKERRPSHVTRVHQQ
jgi:transcriptional regulator with XRE-family HTH domain